MDMKRLFHQREIHHCFFVVTFESQVSLQVSTFIHRHCNFYQKNRSIKIVAHLSFYTNPQVYEYFKYCSSIIMRYKTFCEKISSIFCVISYRYKLVYQSFVSIQTIQKSSNSSGRFKCVSFDFNVFIPYKTMFDFTNAKF